MSLGALITGDGVKLAAQAADQTQKDNTGPGISGDTENGPNTIKKIWILFSKKLALLQLLSSSCVTQNSDRRIVTFTCMVVLSRAFADTDPPRSRHLGSSKGHGKYFPVQHPQ